MGIPAPTARPAAAGRDRGYHPLRVRRIVRETPDAVSIVLDVPEDLQDAFAYDAGQFCTFRVAVEGEVLLRCYSMSSSPHVDSELQVTVKKVPGGAVSSWLNDALAAGDLIEASPPSGLFRLDEADGDVVAFAGGSGITPIYSILKTALATTSRRVRLLYANRDQDAVIFGAELDALVAQHPDRLLVVHNLDIEHGFVGPDAVRPLAEDAAGAVFYICGPGPFMDVVERTLVADGVARDRIHIERFTADDLPPVPEPTTHEVAATVEVTIELNGKVGTTAHRPGTTILQTARQLGLAAPYSCESGNCATCMAKLVVGEASMRTNNALTPDEVADGWVLTCQAVPTSPSVRVVYE